MTGSPGSAGTGEDAAANPGSGVLLVTRFADLVDDLSLRSKLVYTADALRMAWDRPWLGAGGGAWAVLYPAYQSYGYVTREAHNHYAQTAVEVGLGGLALWVSVAGWFGWRLVMAGRRKGSGAAPAVGSTAAALVVLVHGAADFALSLPAIGIWFWSLAGLSMAGFRGSPIPVAVRRAAFALALFLTVAGLVMSGTFGFAQVEAGIARNGGGLEHWDLAVRVDPRNVELRTGRAAVLERLGEIGTAERELELAAALSPSAESLGRLAGFLERTCPAPFGLEKAEELWVECIRRAPFQMTYRDRLAANLEAQLLLDLGLGRRQAAQALARRILALADETEAKSRLAPDWVPPSRRLATPGPKLAAAEATARAVLGRSGAPATGSDREGKASTPWPAFSGGPEDWDRLESMPPWAGIPAGATPAGGTLVGRALADRVLVVQFDPAGPAACRPGTLASAGALRAWPTEVWSACYVVEVRPGLPPTAAVDSLSRDPYVLGIWPVKR